LLAPAFEDMDAVGSALTEVDCGVSAGSSLEGSATGLAGSENGAGVVTGVLQHEVLFVGHSYLQKILSWKEVERNCENSESSPAVAFWVTGCQKVTMKKNDFFGPTSVLLACFGGFSGSENLTISVT
jgi:hypothetical protein